MRIIQPMRARLGVTISFFILFAGLFLMIFLISASRGVAATNSSTKWVPWFDMGGVHNSGADNRGEGIIFAPLVHGERDIVFTDLRVKFLEEDAREYNLALGYRHMGAHGFNLGAWIGVDFRKSEIDNKFTQLSGGFEALSHNWDFRINWYGPGTDAGDGQEGFSELELTDDNQLFMIGGEEVMLQGVDGEIGVRIPVELLNIDSNQFELRAYGGGFYFDDKDALEEVAGGRARVVLAINDIFDQMPGSRLTAEYEFSYDDVREERHEVGARLRIPLNDPSKSTLQPLAELSHQERRMLEGLERDTDIVTVQSKRESVEDALTYVDFDRVAYVLNGGSITATSNATGPNSLIIVNGTINGAQNVQASQTVQGGASTIQVRGRKSGTVLSFAAPGARPTVTSPAGNVLRLRGNNTHIAGLLIDGQATSNRGIFGGSGLSNIAIQQNTIQNIGNDGIRFSNDNSNVAIFNNNINAADEAIEFIDRNTGITITGNLITGGDEAISFDDNNGSITISSNVINGLTDNGIDFDNNNNQISISANTVTSANDGIFFDNGNSNITIAGNRIDTAANGGNAGVELDNNNSNIIITGNTIIADDDAINIFNGNQNVQITGNTLNAGVNDEGVQFSSNNANVTIASNNIIAGDDGLSFVNNNTGLTISGNTIFSTTEDGMDINNNNAGVISGNIITAPVGDGINLNNNNNFSISGNRFNAIGDDAIRVRANNIVDISNNLFAGPITDRLLRINSAGSVLSGAGNISNVAVTCASGTFTGTVVVSGVILQDGVAPCN